mgnify:CR=1 FL=1
MPFPKKKLFFSAILMLSLLAVNAESTSSPLGDEESRIVELNFTRHIDFPIPMPVQDVYIVLNGSRPDLVYRATPEQAMDPKILALEAYATVNHTPHDPLMETENPIGPFPRGDDLGFTLGEWLAARGEGTYLEEDGNSTMDLVFWNLIPNGTYTVWWAGVTHEPYRFAVAPAGAANGSDNWFKADSTGNGSFHANMQPLPPGSNETRTLIVVRYQSDGIVPGSSPGPYGKTAHVQLLYRMPLREMIKKENESIPISQAEEMQPGLGCIMALGGILSAAFLITLRRRG